MQERGRGVAGLDDVQSNFAFDTAKISGQFQITDRYVASASAEPLQISAPAIALNVPAAVSQATSVAATTATVAPTTTASSGNVAGGLVQALGGTVVRDATAVASGAQAAISLEQQQATQHAFSVAHTDLKTGPTSVLDSRLLAHYYEETGKSAEMASFIALNGDSAHAVSTIGDTQYITVDFSAKDGDGAALLQQLQELGLQHGSSFNSVVSGQIATDKIADLLSVDNLAHANESLIMTNVGNVTTQADAAQRDDDARANYNVDGSGLKIGVISDSFNTSTAATRANNPDNVATNIASNDLPANTTILQDYAGGTDEGRGMAQLIHDIAPGAAITFATAYYGEAGFANNILALAQAGNQVIVDDVFYYSEPAFQDGIIAQAVNTAVTNYGATYLSSAGNQGTGGYEGRFNVNAGTETIGTGAGSIDTVTEKFMEFAPGQDYLVINLQYLDTFLLSWDQNSAAAGNGGGATGDLDFYLTNVDGSVIYRESAEDNIGDDPLEIIDATAQVTGMPNITTGLVLRVGYYGGDMPDWVKLIAFENTFVDPGTSVSDGTTFGHSAAENAISVAAAPYYSTPEYNVNPPVVESFSSKGPVNIWVATDGTHLAEADVRHAPQVTGVDGGNTTFFGSDDTSDTDTNPNFYGTSAAAPDVAATALLMLSENSTLNHADIVNLLMSSAVDMDDPSTSYADTGFDNRTGAGLIDANEAVRLALVVKNGGVISSTTQTQLYGTHFADSMLGGAGNDTLEGAGGNDTLDGAGGSNVASYAQSTSSVSVDLGLQGAAQTTSGAGVDTLTNFSGLIGSDYNDVLTGDGNDNSLSGGTGADTLIGNAGNDTIDGGNGSDSLNGGVGVDTLSFAKLSQAVNVSLANNTVTTYNGADTYQNFENLTGSAFNDTLAGDSSANVLSGGVGNDTITAGADDSIDGGIGTDLVNLSSSTSALTVDLTLTTVQATGAGNQKFTSVEGIIGSEQGDTLTGGAEANLFVGNGGADSLTGAAGADTLQGGAGADYLDGGAGLDVASYADAGSGVTVSLLTQGASQNTGGGGGDTLVAIEGVIGSAYADTITSNTASTTEVNSINAGAGDDYVYDSRGGTTATAETVIGGVGNDTINFSTMGATVGVNVTLAAATAQTIQTGSVQVVQGFENAIGTTFADTLAGTAGANSLSGGDGNDVVSGYFGGNDTLDGGAGTDTVTFVSAQKAVSVSLLNQGSAQSTNVGTMTLTNFENLTGSAYSDTLSGDGGNNTIDGGALNDTIFASLGTDSIIGNSGTDTISYANATNGVTVSLTTTTAQSTGYGTQTIASTTENLAGSAFNDTLTGSTASNSISGAAGADTIIATAGADTLNGGDGSDTVSYATSSANLTVNLATATAQTTGFGGTQTLASIENLISGSGADTLTGSSADNNIAGGAGADVISGGVGGADTLDGGAGTDTASYALATSGVTVSLLSQGSAQATGVGSQTLSNFENLTGSAFADTLTGDTGANSISGAAGNDTLAGGGNGADTLNGGADTDTASFAAATAGVSINLATAGAQTVGSGSVTLVSIENLNGSVFDDSLTGDANANSISGAAGNDTIVLTAGADTLDGGAGVDTLDVSSATSGVTIDLSAAGAQTIGASSVTISSFENVIGSGFADTLSGDGSANSLSGGAGNDTLVASLGHDTLAGGADNDTASWVNATSGVSVDLTIAGEQSTGYAVVALSGIENLTGSSFADSLTGDANANVLSGLGSDDTLRGGGGDDTLNGGAGSDTADFSSGAGGGVTVDLSVTAAQATGVGNVVLVNIENLVGTSHDDSLAGDSNDNRISGGAGNDTVYATSGADTLQGGFDSDTVSYANVSTGVSVDLSSTDAQATGIGSQTISGFETLVGSAFADNLSGDGSDNLVAGGAGADTLAASLGADTLNGGADVDTVTYVNATAGVSVDISAAGAQSTGFGTQTLLNIENATGSAFADSLTGDSNANVLLALGGDDTLRGGGGDDTLNGGAGVDTVNYSGAAGGGVTVDLSLTTAQATGVGQQVLLNIENLIGTGHDDVLAGDAGDNLVAGGNGADTIMASAGSDTLQGGFDTDTLSYANATAGVNVDLSVTDAQSTGFGTQTLSGFENLVGSAYDDRLAGTADDNDVSGGAGADTLVASLGSDTLRGGTGLDTVSYVNATAAVTVDLTAGGAQATGYGTQTLVGVENVTGSDYADTLTGDADANYLSGRGDNDTLAGGGGDDTLSGGGGTDTASYQGAGAAITVDLSVSAAQNTGVGSQVLLSIENLIGSGQDDMLTGNADDNSISGGNGADTIVASAGADTLAGGAGTDTLSYDNASTAVTVDLSAVAAQDTGIGSQTLSGFENLIGSAYGDLLAGDAGANSITAGAGADTVLGGGGADTLNGGAGTDLVSYVDATSGVTVDLTLQGSAQNTGVGAQTLFSFENLRGSDYADSLTGTFGANSLFGDGGNDTLNGYGGNDTLNGSSGNDTVSYRVAASGVTVSLALQGQAQATGVGSQTLIGFENLTGSARNDQLTGDDGANLLQGAGGVDTLVASGGADTLDGGLAVDTASFAAFSDGLTISLGVTGAQTVGSGSVTLIDIENLIGSDGGDVLTGNRGDNLLSGGLGADTLVSTTGSDSLYGGANIDTVSYAGSTHRITVDLTMQGSAQATGDGSQTLTGIENLIGSNQADVLTGDSGDNVIQGGAGADNLSGGVGADTLTGGAATDQLNGGGGDDVLFTLGDNDTMRLGTGSDKVVFTDFQRAVTGDIFDLNNSDTIDLSAVDADTTQAGDQAFHQVAKFDGMAGEFTSKYQANKGVTLLKFDVDGDGKADHTITLEGGDHTDFNGFVY